MFAIEAESSVKTEASVPEMVRFTCPLAALPLLTTDISVGIQPVWSPETVYSLFAVCRSVR